VKSQGPGLGILDALRKVAAALYGAAFELVADNGLVLAASIAFFTIFSLAPLLLLVVAIAGLAFGQDQTRAEIQAQFAAFAATGLALDHINAHKHFHLHPTVASLVVEVGKAYGVKGARVPLEPQSVLARIEPRKSSAVVALTAPFARGLARRFRKAGMAAPDAVFGLAWSGAMTPERLKRLLAQLPDGLSEIYTHPATGPYPGSAPGYV